MTAGQFLPVPMKWYLFIFSVGAFLDGASSLGVAGG